jgi:UDP-glucose 4-epimerase
MAEFRGQQVLIAGGFGFIGSNLAIRLVESGASVAIVDSLEPSCGSNNFNIEPIRNEAQLIEGDCCDLDLMLKLVRGKTHIFNVAGHVSHLESMNDPFADLRMNTMAPLTVLEACRQVNRDVRIVYAGTRQCYGPSDTLPLVETQVLKPVDVNGVNKMAGERLHMVYCLAHGIPAVSLRLVNTYGPRQSVRDARQGFAGWFMRLAIEGKEIQIYGDGRQLRDLNYVDDVVDALLIAGTDNRTAGECFNLGGIAPVSLERYVQAVIAACGSGSYRRIPFPEDSRKIDIGSVYCSFSKFHSTTGWAPRFSLEEGLARTVEYYRSHKAHYW